MQIQHSQRRIYSVFCFLTAVLLIPVPCVIALDQKDGLDILCSKYLCSCPFTEQDHILDCRNRNIVNLPSDITFGSTIERINFEDNKIETVPSNSFYAGEGVLILDLSHNRINYLQTSAFTALENLRQLFLQHNALWTLPLNPFDGLDKVELIDLSFNKLSRVEGTIFKPCKALKELRLSHNQLMIIPHDMFSYTPMLAKLSIDNNGIHTNGLSLQSLPNTLKRLNIGDNPIDKIPTDILSKLSQLTLLDMSGISIKQVEAGNFRGLTNLAKLILNRLPNCQEYKAYAFCGLKNLHSFQSNLNPKLAQIDPKAFKCENSSDPIQLGEFTLSGNARLQTLSGDLLTWKNITSLDLTGNSWKCDCNLRWMINIKVNKDTAPRLRCEHPDRHNGRVILMMEPKEMKCGINWNSDVLTTLGLMVVIVFGMVLTGIIVLAYRRSCCFKCRAKRQAKYVRVVANKDRVDLEWDNTAEP